MIADQVNALNRAREVAAVANLIRLAASTAASSSSSSESSSESSSSTKMSSSASPLPIVVAEAASPPPPPQPASKRISFGIDSLLSDVRRPAVQQQAADLSTSSARSNGTSDDELMDNKSLADSDCCDMGDVDEDVDIEEEEEDVQSETSGDTPVGKMPSRPSPTLASMFQHHPALMPSFINHPGLMRGHPGSGGPGAFGSPVVGGPPHGWPLPYGLAAAAWAQHAASQFVTSKFILMQSAVP